MANPRIRQKTQHSIVKTYMNIHTQNGHESHSFALKYMFEKIYVYIFDCI